MTKGWNQKASNPGTERPPLASIRFKNNRLINSEITTLS